MLAIIVAATLARILQLSQRTLYWDDLIIPARFSPLKVTGEHSLFSLYDGHLMPGSIMVQVGVHHLSPLGWFLPACIIVALTVVSALAWVPVLRQLLPDRHNSARLLALAALLLSPFLMDAAGWWSAALNAYAWQLAAAGTVFFLLKNRPFPAAFCLLAGLFFTEKALTILPLALAILLLRRPFARTDKRSFMTSLAPTAMIWVGWLALFTHLNASTEHTASPTHLISAIPNALLDAIAPGIIGGPWAWDRWSPSKAYANPPLILAIIAVIIVITLVFIFLQQARRPAHLSAALLTSAAYLAALFALLITSRDGANTSDILLRSEHYYADWWTATVLLIAAVVGTGASHEKEEERPPSRQGVLVPLLTVALVTSAVVSTGTWTWAWKDDTNRQYLANLKASLKDHPEPLLKQLTPLEVLTPIVYPYNTISSISGHEQADATKDPTVIDAEGQLTTGAVLAAAHTAQGPEADCGTRVRSGTSGYIAIDNPLPFGEWTWELNTAATSDNVALTLTTPNGLEESSETQARASHVLVGSQLQQQFVRVSGGGGLIKVDVRSPAPGASVCIGAGAIGPLVEAD